MWQHKIHQIEAKPINVATILRDNNWLIRDNNDFNNAQALEGLANQSLTLVKRYEPTKKGKAPQLKEIAIAEINKVSRDEKGGALLEMVLHVKQRDKQRMEVDIPVKMRILSGTLSDSWGERIKFLVGFEQIILEKTLVCLASRIAEKADALFQKALQEDKRSSRPASVEDRDSQAGELNSLTHPPITN